MFAGPPANPRVTASDLRYVIGMDSTRQIRNLALIGFMGAGKSSVGQIVAQRLRFDFLDTDAWIEARAGRTITQIFAEQGEPAFRELERQVVEHLATLSGTIISTGGGLPANGHNFAALQAHSLVVYLWASPETLWQRVRHQRHRPLLDDPDPEAKIRSLLAARDPFYRQADVLITSERRSFVEVALHVINQFRSARPLPP
jgi:shikimate kinase